MWSRPELVTLLATAAALLVLEGTGANEEAKSKCQLLAGVPGVDGFPGRDGRPGMPGPKGDRGMPGQGEKGDAGTPGPSGPRGEDGIPGTKGLRGDDGEKGEKGATGANGKVGPKGTMGLQGAPGNPGVNGGKGDAPVVKKSAFSARASVGKSVPKAPGAIVFDVVVTNDFGHYDEGSGRFRCAIAGHYFFSFHAALAAKSLQVVVMLGDKPQVTFYDHFSGAGGADSMSGGVVLRLKVGDEVWLQMMTINFGLYIDDKRDAVFSGFLLFAD
ncbi:complement C1q tumor necrosis factor-related protein 5-like [Lampetra fluviatilis]